MSWDFKKGIPIYSQIIRKLELDLLSGKYQVGEKLPSVRDLAMEANVNPNTMQRALVEMERSGLIYSERTTGRFVTLEQKRIDDLKDELSKEYFDQFFESLYSLGFSDKEIVLAVKRKCKMED
jgi:DNA-binding transcriptional regulator YhcF (GntR family)